MKDFFNIERLKQRTKTDPLLNKIILSHIICYIGFMVLWKILPLFKTVETPDQWLSYFYLENTKISFRPWTLLTYILGAGNYPSYFLWDMLLLHFIGSISFRLFKRSLTLLLYSLSTLSTGLIFWLGISYLPLFQGETLQLSSVAPIYYAMLAAILSYDFNHKVPLFIFEFPLKFLSLFLLLEELFSIPFAIGKKSLEMNSTLGLSNLASALIGIVYGLCLKKLPYFQKKLNILPKQQTTSNANPSPPMPATGPPLTNVDDILEKIARTGYQSLTPQERQTLFEAGK